MSEWLDPTGLSSYGIGICDRCHEKFFLHQLHRDPNSPGLRVCKADLDIFDPYRLPARQTERISLEFTRPDTPLTGHEEETIVWVIGVEPGTFYALGTESGSALEAEGIS